MTDSSPTDVRGSLRSVDGAGVTRMEARLAAGVDEVWAALTDRARLGDWLGDLQGDLRQGSELTAHFSATGWDGTLRVEACEPPQRLLLRTSAPGEGECEIEVTLTPDGEATTAVFEDRGLPLEMIAAYGGGDQVLVEHLAAHLDQRERSDARTRWLELHPGYQALAADLA